MEFSAVVYKLTFCCSLQFDDKFYKIHHNEKFFKNFKKSILLNLIRKIFPKKRFKLII